MFRQKADENDSGDSGDDSKLPVNDDSVDEPPKKKASSVWTDAVLEQSLEDRGSLMRLERGVRVPRGVETFSVPRDVVEETPERIREIMRIPVQPASSDDPFGDIADLSGVEGFGVANTTKPKEGQELRSYRGRNRAHYHRPSAVSKVMQLPVNQGESEKEQGSAGSWLRGRGRERFSQNAGNSGPQSAKRNWRGELMEEKKAPFIDFQSLRMKLLDAEITPGIPLPELGAQMAEALGESDATTVTKIVTSIGEAKALALFDETKRIESADGMKVANGSRRRTPGGVFIVLFKSDVEISFIIKNDVFPPESYRCDRQFQRGRRRMNFNDKLEQVTKLLQKDANSNSMDVTAQLGEVKPASGLNAHEDTP